MRGRTDPSDQEYTRLYSSQTSRMCRQSSMSTLNANSILMLSTKISFFHNKKNFLAVKVVQYMFYPVKFIRMFPLLYGVVPIYEVTTISSEGTTS